MSPFGPSPNESVGAALSIVTLRVAVEDWPTTSNATALSSAAPSSRAAESTEAEYGAVVSSATFTPRTKNATRLTASLSAASAVMLNVPAVLPAGPMSTWGSCRCTVHPSR